MPGSPAICRTEPVGGAVESVERGADRLQLTVATDERRLVGAHRRPHALLGRPPSVAQRAASRPVASRKG